MRTLKRREQVIKILAPTVSTGSAGSKVTTWVGTAADVKADVQPISSSARIEEYGQRIDNMRLAIVQVGTLAEIGWGVWLAGESAASPPWIIVSKAEWSGLINLVIEKKA